MRRSVTQRCARLLRISAGSLAVLVSLTAPGLAAGARIAGTAGGTGEKPQSKLWFADQSWWAVITREGRGLHFYEFTNGAWAPCAFYGAEISSGGRADVVWTGEYLFVLAYASNTKLFKYTYDRTLRTWNLLPGFPAKVPNGTGSETMVLDADATGRLWVAYESGGNIWTAWSTTADHTLWSQPLSLRSGVDGDDIASVVAFDGKVGVVWSDQVRDEFGFRVHHDADPPQLWDPVEIVDSGSGHADDHICMKASANGTVYLVTKDDFDKMTLHRRNPTSGAWTTKTGVISGTGTRGSLMISDDEARIYVPYVDWDSSPDKIKLRRATYSTLSFKTEVSELISGYTMTDPTGTKQVLPAGNLMCLAYGADVIWWNGWGILPPDGPPPPPPPGLVTAQLIEIPRPAPGHAELELNLPLDERSGTSARDASVNAHLGTLGADTGKAAPTWIAGQSGGGLQFSGSNFVRFESTREIEIAGSFTVEAWVRRRAGVSSIGTIVSKGLSQARNYQMQLLENGRIDFKWELANGDNRGTTSTRSLTAGVWQHVACIYDQTAGTSSIYIEGKLDRSATTTGTPAATHEPLLLGVRLSGSTRKEYLAADVDGVRVWRGVAYKTTFTPGPLPYVPMAPEPDRNVVLTWQPPAGETRPITYTLTYRIDGGIGPTVLASGLTGTTWTHTNPQLGRLCYDVRAITVEDGRTGPPAGACVESQIEPGDPKTALPRETAAKAGAALQPGLMASPNPFNPRTQIQLSAPQAGPAVVALYDVSGRLVRELHRGWLESGAHEFAFDANTPAPALASGVYFLRAQVQGYTLRERLVLLKWTNAQPCSAMRMGEQPSLFGAAEPTPPSTGCVRFGTASFGSPDWVGPFYPSGLKAAQYLRFYATRFDTVEIDATYYATPSPELVDGWARKTPESFTIAAKFPRAIVHAGQGIEPDARRLLHPDATYAERDRFLAAMQRLGPRLGPLLLQFAQFSPAAFATAAPFLERLNRFLSDMPSPFRCAVEIRNPRWITPELAAVCASHAAALVLVDRVRLPHGDEVIARLGAVLGGFAYVRLLGDRQHIETLTRTWEREVIDHGARLERWAGVLAWLRERNIPTFVYANNHYAGHAPETARRLQRLFMARLGKT